MGANPPSGRVLFRNSIREVPAGEPDSRPHRVRDQLRSDELARTMGIAVSLRLRNYAELEARIEAGQTIPQAEMEARYLPLRSDYGSVAAWLVGTGLSLMPEDPNHTNVFAKGTVAQVAAAFRVKFSRVATSKGEFSSAVTAPSLPAAFSGAVLGVNGLQPHIQMHVPKPGLVDVHGMYGLVTPPDILAAYNVPGTLDGTGQTIAIIMCAVPSTSDLTTFWSDVGISRTGSATYTVIKITDGPNTGPTGPNQADAVGEVTMDTEWSTGIAPGAALRLYAIPTLSYYDLLLASQQIMTDGQAKIASYSASGPEEGASLASFMSNSQEFALMAAAGVTFVSSSGDGGSNPDLGDNGYTSTNALSAMYPASDPNVTGIGGTTPNFNMSWTYTGEVVWDDIVAGTPSKGNATGGGISSLFTKPSWQAVSGTLLTAQTMRCVPDISSMSTATYNGGGSGAFIYMGGVTSFGGTSLASPIWAGLAAVIDQARANNATLPVGLLGPFLYPLGSSSYFNEITSGSNGHYSAATGYNLCTGLGSPNLGNIIAQIAHQTPVGNSALGAQALSSITYGTNNTGAGYQALYADAGGNNNTAVGSQALSSNTSGNQNVAAGFLALHGNTTGIDNTAVGYDSVPANTTGSGLTAFGYNSLLNNTTGTQSSATGTGALAQNTVGNYNTADGYKALNKDAGGSQNTGDGFDSLYSNTASADNTAFGFDALFSDTASQNTAVGSGALYSDADGSDDSSVAVGYRALYSNNGGGWNTAVG
ncbi:MAG TPA: protease pro-enzyme activation domain-containing protein, partial [Opitutaceae bacterium]